MEEKEYKMGKDIFKTTLKALLVLIVLVVFVAVGLFVITPRTTAKICSTLGFRHLEASCYELVYARSKNNVDLYNLIVKLGGINKYEKQSNYIKTLQNNTKYSDFCDEFDDSVVSEYKNNKISAKNFVSMYGVNEYLSSSYATDYIAMNKLDDAYSAIVETKSSDREFELAVYYYVDYLYSKGASEAQCKTYIEKLANVADGNIVDYLNQRTLLNDASVVSTEKNIRVLAKYTRVKIAYTKYIVYKVSENAETETARVEWQNALSAYNAEIA